MKQENALKRRYDLAVCAPSVTFAIVNTAPMHTKTLKHLLFLICFFMLMPLSAKKFLLVIDAGHGGHDAGAVGGFSKEKDINLTVALAVGRLVEQNCSDVEVIYTRKTDVFIPLQERADIANKANADLFISIHTNSVADGHAAYGCETYTLCLDRANVNLAVAKRENSVITYEQGYKTKYQGFDPNKAESYIIFEFMQNKFMKQSVELANCIQQQYTRGGRPNKGVKQASLLVLRNTSMPAVLTELGFISTPSEEEYLNSAEGVRILSTSIYNGFLQYLKTYSVKHVKVPQMIDMKHSSSGNAGNIRFDQDSEEAEVVPVETNLSKRKKQKQKKEQEQKAQKAEAEAKKEEKEKKKAEAAQKKDEAAPKKAEPAPQKKESAPKKESKPAPQPTPAAKNNKQEEKKKPTTAPEPKKAEPSKGKPAAPAAKEKPATAKEKPTAKPTAQSPAFMIQVASTQAKPKTSHLQMKGYDVTVVQKGNMYAYMVGSYASRTEANKDLGNVQKQFPGAFVVQMSAVKPVETAPAKPAAEKPSSKTQQQAKPAPAKQKAEKVPAKSEVKDSKSAPKNAKAEPAKEKKEAQGATVYKIQFATSPSADGSGDKRISSVKGATSYKVGKSYAHVVGNYKTRAEAQQALKRMKKDFPDAFIVTFVNGKRVTNK